MAVGDVADKRCDRVQPGDKVQVLLEVESVVKAASGVTLHFVGGGQAAYNWGAIVIAVVDGPRL